MENTIVWADIPVTDLDRAMEFYGAVLQRKFVEGRGHGRDRDGGPERGRVGGRSRASSP